MKTHQHQTQLCCKFNALEILELLLLLLHFSMFLLLSLETDQEK